MLCCEICTAHQSGEWAMVVIVGFRCTYALVASLARSPAVVREACSWVCVAFYFAIGDRGEGPPQHIALALRLRLPPASRIPCSALFFLLARWRLVSILRVWHRGWDRNFYGVWG